MSTIPTLAANATLPSIDYNAIANMLNQEDDYIEHIPVANESTPASGTADWFTFGTITVPAWATKARVTVVIDNVFSGGVTGIATCVIKIGTVASGNRNVQGIAATGGHSWCAAALLSGIPTGSQTLKLTATFTSGAVISIGTSSVASAVIDYLG